MFGGEDQGRELRTTQVIDLKTRQVLLGHQLPTPLGQCGGGAGGCAEPPMGGRTGLAPRHREGVEVTTRSRWYTVKRKYPVSECGRLAAQQIHAVQQRAANARISNRIRKLPG